MVGSRYAGVVLWVASWSFAACGGATAPELDPDGRAAQGGARASGGAPGAGGRAAGGLATGGRKAGGGTTAAGGSVGVGAGSGKGGVAGGGNGGTKPPPPGGGHDLYAYQFDQHCRYDTDCALVTEGNQCQSSRCPNAAISSSALEQWHALSKNMACGPSSPREPSPECAPVVPACQGGFCRPREPYYLDPSTFDRTCLIDSDCVRVPAGEACDPCGCVFGSIAKAVVPAYQTDFEKQRTLCAPPPSTCDCAAGHPLCVYHPEFSRTLCDLR